LMVPIMYRQRCRARLAFVQSMDLISAQPGPVLLYLLFLLLWAVAVFMIAGAVTCATCCIAAIPYVGTVILLPIPVTFGAFSLLFLRQLGRDYDVWGDVMPPEFLPILMPPPAPSGTEAGSLTDQTLGSYAIPRHSVRKTNDQRFSAPRRMTFK